MSHLIALALVAGDVCIRALRLRLLLPGHAVPLGRLAIVNASGEVASALTPARLGGDAARFMALRKWGVGAPAALVASAAERVIDWSFILVVAAVGGVLLGGTVLEGLDRVRDALRSPLWRGLVAAAVILMIAALVVARRYRHRFPAVARGLGETLRAARALLFGGEKGKGKRETYGSSDARAVLFPFPFSLFPLLPVVLLTLLSMALRTAILPVLVWTVPGLDRAAVWLGSFALLYGQLVLPTPAGAGGVELGFVAGFSGPLDAARIAQVLVAWRLYTLVAGPAMVAVGVVVARLNSKRQGVSRER